MKTIFFAVLLAALLAGTIVAQSVTITPKKQIYRRPKPVMESKKTFSIRRPIARASTAYLSRKITTAIDPVTILDIRLKDELGEYQWLEQADYKVFYNRNGVLSMELWMEASAAYPDSLTKHVVVDLATGSRVKPADIFVNLPALASSVKRLQTEEVRAAKAEIKKDSEADDNELDHLFAQTDFTTKDLAEFTVNGSGVTFHYDYAFPHVAKALAPPGEFFLAFEQIKTYIRRDGLLARFIR